MTAEPGRGCFTGEPIVKFSGSGEYADAAGADEKPDDDQDYAPKDAVAEDADDSGNDEDGCDDPQDEVH